jgi:hypothetical protein
VRLLLPLLVLPLSELIVYEIDSIPDSHTPLYIDWPSEATVCGGADVTWFVPSFLTRLAASPSFPSLLAPSDSLSRACRTGGATNTSLWTSVWVNGHGFLSQIGAKEAGQKRQSVAWREHYPEGSEVTFEIRPVRLSFVAFLLGFSRSIST